MISNSHAPLVRLSVLAGVSILPLCTLLSAQTSQPASDQPSQTKNEFSLTQDRERQATTSQPSEKPQEAQATKPAFYRTKGWGGRPEREPPGYVKSFDKFGIPGTQDMKWLDFGIEHRTRFEHRDDDYRRPDFGNDDPFVMRSRAYFGVRDILDPLRLAVEFQDSRLFGSGFPPSNRDTDENDFLQAYAQLYFKDAMGKGEPLSLSAGRMTLDFTDGHLVSRSRWANTTFAFDGFRLRMGELTSDWEFNFFAVQPVERLLRQPDRPDEERWFYGFVGAWRKWSQYVTLEPYYFILDEDRTDRNQLDRTIHTMGLYWFGPIGHTGFDYDVDTAWQFGSEEEFKQRAFGSIAELGYTFQHPWNPRLSVWTMYASGDQDPYDHVDERFVRLFDSAHPYATSDFFTWQNVISSKLRYEMKPTDKLRFDTSYGGYWLASDTDAWVAVGRRDSTGRSGDFVGQEFDARIRYQVDEHIDLDIGYAHFIPGPFANNTGPSDDSDIFYVSTTLHL